MSVSDNRARAMTRRLLAWFLPALLLIVGVAIENGGVVRAQDRRQDDQGRRSVRGVGRVRASLLEGRNEFILRAPADRIAAIAARRGLTVISRLRPLDDRGTGVFLVSGPSRFGSRFDRLRDADKPAVEQLVKEVEDDVDVGQFELNTVVVTPEVAAGFNLNGSTVSILDALSDRTVVDYFGGQVWNGYANQAATSAIRLAASHGAGATGAGIVAIIDTGVDPHHPLLAGSLVPGYDFINDVAGEASEWTDLDGSTVSILDGSTVSILDQQSVLLLNGSTVAILDEDAAAALNPTLLPEAFGHGTMVAGLVHLVAPTAKIMPLKAFKADGTSTVFDIVRAIHYAIDHGARVINMSFSATVASPEIAHAINVATSRGIICVASAGNLGQEVLVYPGALRNVLGVGSTTTANPPTRSLFSNYGDALVSLGAPGEGIITTYPGGGYAGVWGTSFSAPLTAGAAALLLQVDPTLDQFKADHLLGNADRMEAGMGKGRLNLDVAVRALPDATPPAVTMTSPSGGVLFGSIDVSAFASDNVGVAGVKFLLDNNPLGAEDTAAPYKLTWPTATTSNGTHSLTAVARDAAGNQTTAASISVTVANDTTAPTVALTSPGIGATVNGTVTVSATASDDLEVFGVQFKLDGVPLGAEDALAPYEVIWTTGTAVNGAHTLTAVARDAAGHSTTTASVSVTVANDAAAPAVVLTTPVAGATIGGMAVLLATASDDVGVVGVQFKFDGALLGAEDTAAPYELAWDTTTAANGAHTITAVARDAAGRQVTAAGVSVTVANDTTAPTVAVSSPAAAGSVTGTVTVAATATDDASVAAVQFRLDGATLGVEDTTAPYEVAWNTLTAANGAHTITAVARDAAGNQATATSVSVTVANDTAAPTVALTSPVAGATVGGLTALLATASDDVGVVGVQFKVDGALLGAEDTVAPYELAWDTTTAANGAHTITAVARDAAGNQAPAASISVTVANDAASPTVALTSPAAASSVSGTVTVAATASDDIGVVSVAFLLDGAPLGAADLAAPYEVAWPTAAVANGAHTITAVARDAAGNQTTAASVGVIVANDTVAPAVALHSPDAAITVVGTVLVAATAWDNVGVVSVEFLLDGAPLGAADLEAPYQLMWPTLSVANGAHTLTAVARDAAGNQTTATSISVTVANDTTVPTVALTGPAAASSVSGTVTVAATASDDVGVVRVAFLLDGVSLGVDHDAPYELAWPTAAVANGVHTITAVSRDAAGNQSTTASVSVTVANDTTAPTVALYSPDTASTVIGTVMVAATAWDNVGVVSVEFLLDGEPLGAADLAAPYQLMWPTATAANGTHTITAVARDAMGHATTATSISVTVANDITAPIVAVTSPAEASSLSGTVTVTAAASDNVGVVSVEFLLDGLPLGAADLGAPYELAWPTATATNGTHTLTAVARDAAGNPATATSVSVTVANDIMAPTVALTSPAAASTVDDDQVMVAATASDNVGVVSVQFFLDGTPLGAADVVAPYVVWWNADAATEGTHTLTAVAFDAAGNQTTSTGVSVTAVDTHGGPGPG